MVLKVSNQISIPRKEFEFSFVRSSGPGGQKVNKASTKAELRWNVDESPSISKKVKDRIKGLFKNKINEEGELILRSDRFRTQERNIADCLDKLKVILLKASTVPKKRVPTKPTKGSKERRILSKKRRAQRIKERKVY